MKIRIKAGVCSDRGKLSEVNEDNFLFHKKCQNANRDRNRLKKGAVFKMPVLFAVCDGMGGIQNGERASEIVVRKLREKIAAMDGTENSTDMLSRIEAAVGSCNEAVCDEAKKLGPMGSTLAMLYFSEKEIWLSNIGDSRIYSYYKGVLSQLSVDHNLEEELRTIGMVSEESRLNRRGHHELTQYLGIPSTELKIEPHYLSMEYKLGRTLFLICSDGVSGFIALEQMQDILEKTQGPKNAAIRLVNAAVENGSKDDVTAIVIEIMRNESKIWMR